MTKRDLVMPGDLIFYAVTPDSPFISKLIAMVQLWRSEGKVKTYYSHVGICDFSKQYILEARPIKSRSTLINWDDPRIEIWRVKQIPLWQVGAAVNKAHMQLGRYYGIGQIFMGLFAIGNTYTCSQFVREAYKNAYIDLAPNAGRFLGPNELMNLDLLERIA